MTEEIIVDCAFYKGGVCASPINKTCEYCKNIDVSKCYHKQLKRLKQENKRYKQLLQGCPAEDDDCGFCEIDKRNKELEQENKKLKDKITALEDKLQLRMASDKESDEFWDEIFSAEDYPFNKENAYKELKDYYFVLEQIPKIYMEITGGTLSKTTYFASSVVEAYNDALERYYNEIDDLEYNNNAYRSALEEIKKYCEEQNLKADWTACNILKMTEDVLQ